jgi:hypothetical protein
MPIFVYLFDVLGVVPSSTKITINLLLQSFFNQVTAFGGGNDTVTVAWPGGIPTLGSADLLLYYFRSPFSLMIQAQSATGKIPAEGAGLTIFGGPLGTLSELRPTPVIGNPQVVTNLTFHELMHNRLQMGDSLLHSGDGLAVADPSFATLSTANKAAMAPVLSSPISQFTQGMTILSNDLSAQNSNDPLAAATVPWADINVGQ